MDELNRVIPLFLSVVSGCMWVFISRHPLNREKVIAGKSTATIFVGPLKAGRYSFVGEYNEKTATGVVVAK